jgi:hypothetical protein
MLVFYTPSLPAHTSLAAHGVADSARVYEALKMHDGKRPHYVDVHVDEGGMPEFAGDMFVDAGKGNVRFGGHGGLARSAE